MDLLKDLGTLAFASRLRRLSDRLMRDVAKLYKDHETEFQPRWFPVAYLLKNVSSLSITDLADKLGMTHPAIIQISDQMLAQNLLLSKKDKDDERRRLLSLSAKGKKTVLKLEGLWREISKCTQEVIDQSGVDMLAAISIMEDELNKNNMYDRITEKRNKKP
jgi:DNA-binding MarR family transcriptional regulator